MNSLIHNWKCWFPLGPKVTFTLFQKSILDPKIQVYANFRKIINFSFGAKIDFFPPRKMAEMDFYGFSVLRR